MVSIPKSMNNHILPTERIKISNDILQYILNPYLGYANDCYKIQKVFLNLPKGDSLDLKFIERPHLSYKFGNGRYSSFGHSYNYNYTIKFTYRDNILIREEGFYLSGAKYFSINIAWRKNYQIYIDKCYYWWENGNIRALYNYNRRGNFDGDFFEYYENGIKMEWRYYVNGISMKYSKYNTHGKLECTGYRKGKKLVHLKR